eukprot:495482-Pyramimonas_sp.AAC.2
MDQSEFGKRRYILMMDQSDSGSAGIFYIVCVRGLEAAAGTTTPAPCGMSLIDLVLHFHATCQQRTADD